jgi:hypothetical protein
MMRIEHDNIMHKILNEIHTDRFRMDLQALFSVYNSGAQHRPWKIIIFLTHLFNARKASLTSRVTSFYSNIRAKLACIDIQTNVTQAYLAY